MSQRKINFKGAAAIPVVTKTTTTNTLEENDNIHNEPKRQRTERTDRTDQEFEDGELRDDLLQIPPNELDSAGSEQSLLNSDSISTIVDTGPKESPPVRRTNNTHFLTADEIDVKVIKLERLRDKSDRYSSHI